MEQQPENTVETSNVITLANESIMHNIFNIRGEKVILDFHLASLYKVENRVLKQAVKRKKNRFPADFMFELTKDEWNEVITICDNLPKGVKFSPTPPFAFTEQGLAMLSSVLNSELAIAINIQIMRIFTKMRQFLNDTTQIHLELADMRLAMEKLSKKQDSQGKNIDLVFEYIDRLENKLDKPPLPERDKIGYKVGKEG